MRTELEQIWSQVQEGLHARVEGSTYRVWLEPLRPQGLTGDRLTVEAPPHACEWIRARFARLLQASAAAALGRPVTIDVVPAQLPPPARGAARTSGEQRRRPQVAARPSPDPALPQTDSAATFLERPPNPRLTFEHFVIGDSNRLAHAAALTVAELPGQAYNPLFVCGAPGVGKTHLLHSIANLIYVCNPGLSVRATTGESFTNEFQAALGRGGSMGSFKARFRQVDVLLVDDVQFLERKARTEEEFFHTFNALHEGGAQLVLTSDRPPRDLQALEDRLRERFEAGLVADIAPPDLNTRLAILRKRTQQDNIELHDGEEVLEAIAQRVTVNIRVLEGTLIRIVAFSSLTGKPLTTSLAMEVLDGLHPKRRSTPPSVAEVQAAACEHFGLSTAELLSPSRAIRVTWPRQVAMYLARELTSDSLPAIGRHFGGRDHTTVMHALRRTETKIAADSDSRRAVDAVRQQLRQKLS